MSKNDFNATINLPKTDFPMRAGLAKREPEMLQHWYDMDLYHEMLKKNDGKPRFSLHDGPPFSNGDIHMGHALNKALKDFIIRSYAMRGYYTQTINPDALGHSEGERIENLVQVMDGYFDQGAHHLNVNVFGKEKLIDAMEHPEKEEYANFTIRVSGYAVKFIDLTREQQMDVISRTCHAAL